MDVITARTIDVLDFQMDADRARVIARYPAPVIVASFADFSPVAKKFGDRLLDDLSVYLSGRSRDLIDERAPVEVTRTIS